MHDEHAHRRIDRLERLLARHNNPAPSVPIYDTDNFPQDAFDGQVAIGEDGHLYHYIGGNWSSDHQRISTLNAIIDGGGDVIPTGIVGDVRINSNCQITEVVLLADESGNVEVDIWKAPYSSFPPVVGNSITDGHKPTLSGAYKYQDTSLIGWNTTINSGDVLRFNIDSVTSIQRLDISLVLLIGGL